MCKVTTLAEGKLFSTHSVTIELVEADKTPTVVIVRWSKDAIH